MERLRARIEPVSEATPTYRRPGVRGSSGAMSDLTRSRGGGGRQTFRSDKRSHSRKRNAEKMRWMKGDARSTACSIPIHLDTTPCTCAWTSLVTPVTALRAVPIWVSRTDGVSTRTISCSGSG